MRFGILNIGDELLAGKILNGNQYDLARMLRPLGHEIFYGLVAGDDEGRLADMLDAALGAAGGGSGSLPRRLPKVDVLILTGGLGPTRDDLTRQAAAAWLGVPVQESPEAVEWLCAFLGKAPEELAPGQRVQTLLPAGSEPLRNPAGTACGFRFRAAGTEVYAFPGVPAELDAMARLHVLPRLPADRVLIEKGVWTWGWSEGTQREALQGLRLPEGWSFSSLPGERGVRIAVSCLATPAERKAREAELAALWPALVAAIPADSLVDADGADLPNAVLARLRARKAMLALAESCTGGGAASLLTDVPGSSEGFAAGFVTYSNQAKVDLLGVDPKLIEQHGAVSEAVALAMARGGLERTGAGFGLAITGIAGPGGGTPDKPVGTVWIAVASREAGEARKYHFRGDRIAVRLRSAYAALNQLRIFLSK